MFLVSCICSGEGGRVGEEYAGMGLWPDVMLNRRLLTC